MKARSTKEISVDVRTPTSTCPSHSVLESDDGDIRHLFSHSSSHNLATQTSDYVSGDLASEALLVALSTKKGVNQRDSESNNQQRPRDYRLGRYVESNGKINSFQCNIHADNCN